jgi:polysaccharide biosynthesis protein PslG
VRRPRAVALIATALALALITLGAAASGAAVRKSKTSARVAALPVPSRFVGVDVDGPMLDPPSSLDLANQFGDMVSSGVESVRVAFNWAFAQPYQNWSDVPASQQSEFTNVNGMPIDFSQTDQVVGLAAQRGLSVLPTVLYAPPWDGVSNPAGVAFPARPGPYAAYLTALIHRYGPHGSFWSANPHIRRQPIRMWQIWNEEQLAYYWHQPFVKGYVALLRASHTAIKRADPGAKVVLGSVTNTAWKTLGQIYKGGARKLFDVVSVNAFTRTPANVVLYLRLTRRAMDRFKDGKKPMIATELSWTSAKGNTKTVYTWDTTAAGQARNIAALLPMLGSDRTQLGLMGFYYYTWIGLEQHGGPDFSFAGLEGLNSSGSVFSKPALGAFRHAALALEKCKLKGSTATRCRKRAK